MSLVVGIAILALAVLLGGLAALLRHPSRAMFAPIRTFAIVAAASVALLHLLPEAVVDVGPFAIVAAAAGALVPALLERLSSPHHDHAKDPPSTALAIGYAAVVAHQAGEGAAVASLARTGALSIGLVLAIAAHTVPLAMVVALRVLEVRGGRGRKRALAAALTGVALATALGALAGNLVGLDRMERYQPWILAVVAGILLHALAHDALSTARTSRGARAVDAAVGIVGLLVALFGVEDTAWTAAFSPLLRAAGVVGLSALIVAWSFLRRAAQGQAHGHEHAHHEHAHHDHAGEHARSDDLGHHTDDHASR